MQHTKHGAELPSYEFLDSTGLQTGFTLLHEQTFPWSFTALKTEELNESVRTADRAHEFTQA